MATVKYRVREYNPTENQGGSHSFYAEAVVSQEINNVELAKKIAARTGTKAYEAQMLVAAIADIVNEELLEGSRITLSDEKGMKVLSIYGKVSGSISDKDVQDNPTKYNNATKATEDMLTQDLLTWTVGATVGVKFSKLFGLNKTAQKVKFVATDVAITDTETGEDNTQTGGNTGGSTGGEDVPPENG